MIHQLKTEGMNQSQMVGRVAKSEQTGKEISRLKFAEQKYATLIFKFIHQH